MLDHIKYLLILVIIDSSPQLTHYMSLPGFPKTTRHACSQGADSVQKGKSMFAVCYCGFDRAACGACGRGYQQEVSAGRSPKFIECPDGSTMTVNKQTNVVSVLKKMSLV